MSHHAAHQEREWLDSSGGRHAGLLAEEDLRDWAPAWEEPLSVDDHGYEVFKAGPWSQAPVFLQQLRLLEGFDLAGMPRAGAEWVHTITECAKLAFADPKDLHARHRAIEFKKFLDQLEREVPAELEVHLILDNYANHKAPTAKRWLLRHPRFLLHFTPKSASWLNLVERWFAEITTKMLRRGVHRSVADLEADIRTWLAHWNENPRPYVWVKTADEILANLTRYCERISEAGH